MGLFGQHNIFLVCYLLNLYLDHGDGLFPYGLRGEYCSISSKILQTCKVYTLSRPFFKTEKGMWIAGLWIKWINYMLQYKQKDVEEKKYFNFKTSVATNNKRDVRANYLIT